MAGSKGIVSSQFYTFSAANKTITFSNDYAGLDLGEITYITNIKNGVATVIYDPFDATKGGTLNGLTLTLAYNTTTMADTDPLQIITGFTPVDADPLPVRIVEGPDQKDDTTLLQNISDNLDYLNLALDQSEGIQMNTREINPTKKDTENAIILSDNIETRYVIPASTSNVFSPIVDTKGYQTVTWTAGLAGGASVSWGITNPPQFSSDGVNWVSIPCFYSLNGNAPTYLTGGVGTTGPVAFWAQVVGRYFRVQMSNNTAGVSMPVTITLKNTPLSAIFTHNNITLVNGSTPQLIAGSSVNAGFGASSAGGFPTAGGYAPTQNPPGAATNLSTNIPYPIGIGGREWPYVGALAGVFRYINVDARGNIQIGGDTAFRTPNMGGFMEQSAAGTTRGIGGVFNNIQGAQSLTVADTNQVEGDTNTMLLKQILQELKILNQQLTEIPFLMNVGQSKMSDPQEYRDDNSMLF